ncbi:MULTISPECIES: hypothetical protein [unclassified Paraburkholderia]|uniref:hypothetical protein n=1 Tax=unclassified Paraburkholderia TaxID=2615204 RepID=UPI002AB1D9FA|nr:MULTISPECIES: hypothetical protein [unclassified Paraburkholderia]
MSTEDITPLDISKIVAAGIGEQGNSGEPALQAKTPEELAAESALRDLDAAVEMSKADGEGVTPARDEAADVEEDPAATRARLMKKASNQRERGRKALTTPTAGIVMAPQQVVVKDRVVGSALERYLGAIDYCAHNLQRYGEMVLGERYQEIEAQLRSLVDELNDDASKELGRVAMLVTEGMAQVESEGMPWITPVVIAPAVSMDALFRSRVGIKLFRGVMKFDQALEKMAGLEWNELIEDGETAKRQLLAKQALGKIYGFASHVNRSLRNRAGTSASQPDAQKQASNDRSESPLAA